MKDSSIENQYLYKMTFAASKEMQISYKYERGMLILLIDYDDDHAPLEYQFVH